MSAAQFLRSDHRPNFTEAIRQRAMLPPLMVYLNGVDFWLADGFHRVHSYRAAGVTECPTDTGL